ncbi:PLP-dependent aminotransferase family protein [Paenibacillus humicus]|uniref:MocR-like pyridoxine biosynthesis transcription factor PdxR n=1 Tax=Paenibacillus humicus TaxID=412861 RepID=UPI003F18730F
MWGIRLQPGQEVPMSRQLFLALKDIILSGEIAQGEELPSTREMAKLLGVSRNTVNEGYDMLLTEGFVVSRPGAATRVADGLRLSPSAADSGDGQAQRGGLQSLAPPLLADFKTGQPDLSRFPWTAWNQLLRKAAEGMTPELLGYSGPKGHEPLCTEIAAWMLRSRGVKVDPRHIFITAGTTQALHILADLLHKDGCSFVVENPSHPSTSTIMMDKGYSCRWLKADGAGADVDSLDGERVSAVCVTPSHQFPLGGILPASRRAALIRMAEEHGFYIVEDDYDSEFRYSGAPVSPIYSMDSSRTIYAGTFSKTLFPALRIGFVILPEPLHEEWSRRRTFAGVQNPMLEQAALAEFLRSRRMDKHMRLMRREYGEKRRLLLSTIDRVFGSGASCQGDASGLHLVLEVAGLQCGKTFAAESLEAGVRAYPLIEYCHDGEDGENGFRSKLLLGYGHLDPARIEEQVRILHAFLARWMSRQARI